MFCETARTQGHGLDSLMYSKQKYIHKRWMSIPKRKGPPYMTIPFSNPSACKTSATIHCFSRIINPLSGVTAPHCVGKDPM